MSTQGQHPTLLDCESRTAVAVVRCGTSDADASRVSRQLRLAHHVRHADREHGSLGAGRCPASLKEHHSPPDTNRSIETVRVLVLLTPRGGAWWPCGRWLRWPPPPRQRLSSGPARQRESKQSRLLAHSRRSRRPASLNVGTAELEGDLLRNWYGCASRARMRVAAKSGGPGGHA